MSYSDRMVVAVELGAVTLSTSNADDLLFRLPTGYAGKLIDANAFLTTATTGAATNITLGTGAADSTYGNVAVPVASINTRATTVVSSVTTIPKDTTVTVGHDGGSTAGAGTVTLYFELFKV